MDAINGRIQLANDLLAIGCKEAAFDSGKDISDYEACLEAQAALTEVSSFLLSDSDTKIDMIEEWGGNMKQAATEFWGKSSTKVVHFGADVQEEIKDFWG